MAGPRKPAHPDLFGWSSAAQAIQEFEPEQVRAATLAGVICKAMKLALAECGEDRETIAYRMSGFLGERVSKNMLNAYVSEGATEKAIPLPRFIAFVQATGDMRLLNLIATPFDRLVVDRRCEGWIRAGQLAAAAREKQAELQATETEFNFALRMAKGAARR
ncbi:DNA transposition protein [Ferrovibrio sp.]|uniref:DNA transposition protein n=1 Tax=Ferrovibrio sp. TaxID=1917215 RepID=UPI0025BEB137|nr:DNA transposition protein [Ferrovibrio sp.]MBX3455795.1 DNA transposition protein [Ferrovibrio sp.]